MKKEFIALTGEEKNNLKKQLEIKYTEILELMTSFNNEIAPEQHIKETPKRIAKMYVDELLTGCYTNPPDMKIFENKDGQENPVIVDNITIKSLCSHHFVPFKGTAIIYYVPDKHVSGLSKFSRICEYYSRRPQIQEELTQQICDHLYEKLSPKFVAIAISAQHLCMLHRGINEHNASCITYSQKIKNNNDTDKYKYIQKFLMEQLKK